MKKSHLIIYWVSTAIISGAMLLSAYHLLSAPDIDAAMSHLGFPGYFGIELGLAKGLGAIVLILPWFSMRVKGFAYSGFAIALISAVIAHTAVGDPLAAPLKAGVFLIVLVISYIYLPPKVS